MASMAAVVVEELWIKQDSVCASVGVFPQRSGGLNLCRSVFQKDGTAQLYIYYIFELRGTLLRLKVLSRYTKNDGKDRPRSEARNSSNSSSDSSASRKLFSSV